MADLTAELKRLEVRHETEREINAGDDLAIRRLTHSRICSSIADSPFEPGIFFTESHGTVRTTDLETDVVRYLGEWLDSESAANLRASLAAELGRRIAVLIADRKGPAEGMIRTLQEDNDTPVTPLTLPAEIDVMILIAGNHVLDYDAVNGWQRREMETLRIPLTAT